MKRSWDSNARDAANDSRRDGPKSFYNLKEALESGKKEIFHAMRLARGFERQKLGRRHKDATESNSTDDIARIDNEIVVLKAFDLAAMAEFYLYKTLLKIPSICSTPQFPASIATTVAEARKPLDTAYLNVSARLFKSNAVSTALETSLKGIYEVVGVEPQMGRKKRLRKNDFKPTDSAATEQHQPASHNEVAKKQGAAAAPGKSETAPAQEPRARVESGVTNGEHESSSDISSDSLSSNVPEAGPERIVEGNDSSEEDSSDDAEDRDLKLARKPLTTTAFLPSLASGYISGSDSEASDLDDVDEQRPKNRPGQRARQALWERKYGKSAAHLQKQRQSRDYGWDAKKGAQDSSARSKHKAKGKPDFQSKQASKSKDRNAALVRNPRADAKHPLKENPRSREKPGPLHPSWEAARKQKQETNAAAFKGKKIVFD